MVRSRATLLVLFGSMGLLAPTRGADPRVTLRLEHATADEAAQALTRATGVPVEIAPWPLPDVPGLAVPPLADLGRTSRFEWSQVSLSQALRDVGRRYSLQPSPRLGGGYVLQQGPLTPEREYGALAQTEFRGLRLQVRSLAVSGTQPGADPGEKLQIRLHAQALTGDAGAIVGLEDLVARDDRGGVLTLARNTGAGLDHGYPDEWSSTFQLTGLQPGARRLEFLEGTLISAPVFRTARLELPYPPPASGLPHRLGGRTVELKELPVRPSRLFVYPTEWQSAGPLLQVRVTQAVAEPFTLRGHPPGTIPILVGASGQTYAPTSLSAQGQSQEDLFVNNLTLRYPYYRERLVGVRIDQVERREPRSLGTFRLRNVPLPVERPARAGKPYVGALQAGPLSPESPDYSPAGATLISPVQVGGQAVTSGRLFLGLSDPNGATRTRWYEARLDGPGAATLPDVKPGTYRVLRVYQAPRSTGGREVALDIPGWWRNEEVILPVEAGSEARLPPLQYLPGLPVPPSHALPARAERMEVSLDDALLSYTRTLELLSRPEAHYEGALNLELSGTVRAEAASLLGLGNVVARDDRGGLLTQRFRGSLQTSSGGEAGLKWAQSVSLNVPHPEARSLSWVEGDLLAFRRREEVRAEFPLPLPAGGARKEVGELQLQVDSLEQVQPTALAGEPPPAREYRLRGRLLGPSGTEITDMRGNRWQPTLTGRSGMVYYPARNYDLVASDGNRQEFRCRFELPEPAEQISFHLRARLHPVPVASFRMVHVPLPEPRPFMPPKGSLAEARGQRRPVAGEARVSAFQQAGGAELILPVRVAGRPQAEGSLQVGVSARTPQGWSAVRWVEVELVENEARLRDLAPGTYRIFRRYQAADPAAQPAGGTWAGAEIQVTLAAGQAATAPPLLWKRGR